MIRKFLAMIIAATLIGVAAPSPARADWSDCDYSGTVCLAAHANWGNPVWRQYPSQINGCEALYGFNDITTMVVNNSDEYSLTVYEHGTCTGSRLLIVSGQAVNFAGTFRNDTISSVRVTWHG